MWQVIDLEAIRSRVQGRLRRSGTDAGVVEKRRKVQASKPVFRGTRVPVEAVRAYSEAGKTSSEILDAFPSLTEEDVKAAEASSLAVAYMRFVLDEDVDANAVGSFLRQRGHECWSAVLITDDADATRRRRRFTFGRYVLLTCHQLEAVELLELHVEELVMQVPRRHIGVFEIRRAAIVYQLPRYDTH